MKNLTLLFLSFVLVFSSCKKDEFEPLPEPPTEIVDTIPTPPIDEELYIPDYTFLESIEGYWFNNKGYCKNVEPEEDFIQITKSIDLLQYYVWSQSWNKSWMINPDTLTGGAIIPLQEFSTDEPTIKIRGKINNGEFSYDILTPGKPTYSCKLTMGR